MGTARAMARLATSLCGLVLLLGNILQEGSALQCYECDGVKGTELPCAGDGAGQIGTEVSCDDKCGLLLEERLTERGGSVVSSDGRWRRGCATDGHEMTDNSEAQPGSLDGSLGCQQVGQRSEGNLIVRHTLCLCNTTLCNTHKNDMNGAAVKKPEYMVVGWAIALALYQMAGRV